jgi:hypothetical protein
MNEDLRKKSGMSFLKKLDTRFSDNILWQFIKFSQQHHEAINII